MITFTCVNIPSVRHEYLSVYRTIKTKLDYHDDLPIDIYPKSSSFVCIIDYVKKFIIKRLNLFDKV